MKISILIFSLIFFINAYPQKFIEEYKPPQGYLKTGPEEEDILPMVEKGFTLILSESKETEGVLILPLAKRKKIKENFENEILEKTAVENNLAVLHIITGNPLDFYFDSGELSNLIKSIQEILNDNDLRDKPVFLFGQSLEGTRALRLAVYLASNRQKFWLMPSAVAVMDSPLDMVRYQDELNRTILNRFNETAVNEAKQLLYVIKENLGTPEENYNNYVDYSPFTYEYKYGGNADELRSIPVRAYYDPDVNWWIENYRKDYYSMNAIDLAGLINQLKVMNNDETELISLNSSGSKDRLVINYPDLINWFLKFKEN